MSDHDTPAVWFLVGGMIIDWLLYLFVVRRDPRDLARVKYGRCDQVYQYTLLAGFTLARLLMSRPTRIHRTFLVQQDEHLTVRVQRSKRRLKQLAACWFQYIAWERSTFSRSMPPCAHPSRRPTDDYPVSSVISCTQCSPQTVFPCRMASAE